MPRPEAVPDTTAENAIASQVRRAMETDPRIQAAMAGEPSAAVESSPPFPVATAPEILPIEAAVAAIQPVLPNEVLPARMINEFVYCRRLFYYEHVEGLFLHSADTVRGAAAHACVDSGSGGLPSPQPAAAADAESAAAETAPETIHTRSVEMASDRLGVVAKMDLIEARVEGSGGNPETSAAVSVRPVDYKVGRPREGDTGNELWDTDKIQLGLQCLILRDNGYSCDEGVIYYRGTRQRVRLPITPDLEQWILGQIAAARATARGPIPPPLIASPKCVRCSLAPVCLPDETAALTDAPVDHGSGAAVPPPAPDPDNPTNLATAHAPAIRRLIAPSSDERVLYLNTPGLHVGRREDVLQIRDKKTVIDEIRLQDVHHVALFGNIQISTQAVQRLCESDIPITYFSMGGWFYGLTRGHGLKNIFTRIEQFRLAREPDFALKLAREFVRGKIRNQRTLLQRNHVECPPEVLARLKRAADPDATSAPSTSALLGIEGAAAAEYFTAFPGMLKGGPNPSDSESGATPTTPCNGPNWTFDFRHRNRRPPRDPINALLSLTYSLLAKDCTIAALAVGFDPYVGFFHQPRFGRPALALDLMEEFRPLVADSTVITLVNNRMLDPSHFVRAGAGVNLTASGRKIVFQAYERRMSHLLQHPTFDYKVSYRRALELQFRILARVLTGEVESYHALTTR
jgi:CRISPR-associated protein Cas1